ncbi:glycosyltransferase 61 family protein [Brevundimonas sp.]|uniref:glycosyltransferase 61 family protein n=1 Tax=Brevundimonas sp. TaxID=1871086 RepID=UPI00391B2338
MSLLLAKGLHKAFQALVKDMEAGVRDWTALSIVPGTTNHAATLQMLGEQRLAEVVRQFARFPGHNLSVLKILTRKKVEFLDPLSGKITISTKSLIFRKYSYLFFTGPSGPGFIMCIGSKPYALFYLAKKIWVDIRNHNEDHYAVLSRCHTTAAKLERGFYRYLSEPGAREVGCIVGDERPTHFIRESMGGLQHYIEKGKMDAFWEALDYLIVPIDNSFILTDELFDPPPHVKVIYTNMSDLNRVVMAKNLFVYRLMRSGSHMTDSLRTRLVSYAEKASPAEDWPEVSKLTGREGYRTVWFSVEIEKGRLKNQEAVFSELLLALQDHFGSRVQLIIDGWSPSPIALNTKDYRIISTIRAFYRRAMKKCGVQFSVIESFSMSYREKIKLAAKIDFFVTMHGSAAIVPSLIKQKPGITYHSAWGMTIDHEVWVPTLYRTRTHDQAGHPAVGHWAPFDVDIPAFRDTLDRLIGDLSLAQTPVLAPPGD